MPKQIGIGSKIKLNINDKTESIVVNNNDNIRDIEASLFV